MVMCQPKLYLYNDTDPDSENEIDILNDLF